MNLLTSRCAALVYCAILAALNLVCKSGLAFALEQAPPATAEDQLVQRFAELQTELERLRAYPRTFAVLKVTMAN